MRGKLAYHIKKMLIFIKTVLFYCFMLIRRHLCSEDGNNLHQMFVYSLQIGENEFNKNVI